MNELSEYGFGNSNEGGLIRENSALAAAQEAKSIQEIQAALIIAQKFPRRPSQSFENIMAACERPFLAEQAMYAYPRGNQVVTGPSIRLAEVLAQNWGNIECGIRELSQSDGVSEVEAYAWDYQTNYRSNKIFHVPHERHTKQGKKRLTDPRDIYELVANQGSRRLRACILAVIPGDIVEAAVKKCEKTLSSGKEPIGDRIRKLIEAFNEMDVKVEHLEERLGHKLEVTSEAELVTLRAIYKSLKDGMASREDFFTIGGLISNEQSGSIKNLIENKGKPKVDINEKPQADALADKLK
jgi:hypothetical protein